MSQETDPTGTDPVMARISIVLLVLWLLLGFWSAGSKIYKDVKKHGVAGLISVR